ncbi:MAG: protease inhibitor I42 family protein [Acidimicrobiia bacterium]|nr:protease inhibitor I42 family protein [Acidimicrobiia bacterium]
MKRLVLCVLAQVLVLSGCGDDVNTLSFTAADSGSEVRVGSGDQFQVVLESNPSTGYSWEVTGEPDPGILELVSHSFEGADADLVGAAGTEVFVFKGVGFGAEVLRMEYFRPFDDPPVPERVVEFRVRVDDAPWLSDDAAPPSTSTATAPTVTAVTSSTMIDSAVQVSSLFDGEGARLVRVSGFLLDDGASTRLCELLMESFPPQCGGAWVVIANPGSLDPELREAQGIRWTDLPFVIDAQFDGDRLVLDDPANSVVPTAADSALAEGFMSLVENPSADTVAAISFGDEVILGLSDVVAASFGRNELADPATWVIDESEYDGYAGPFSILDVAKRPIEITIGSHARCAGPPVPAPQGFEGYRRVSIQPTTATSCLEWWTVDFFVDDAGLVKAVTLDLFGP